MRVHVCNVNPSFHTRTGRLTYTIFVVFCAHQMKGSDYKSEPAKKLLNHPSVPSVSSIVKQIWAFSICLLVHEAVVYDGDHNSTKRDNVFDKRLAGSQQKQVPLKPDCYIHLLIKLTN